MITLTSRSYRIIEFPYKLYDSFHNGASITDFTFPNSFEIDRYEMYMSGDISGSSFSTGSFGAVHIGGATDYPFQMNPPSNAAANVITARLSTLYIGGADGHPELASGASAGSLILASSGVGNNSGRIELYGHNHASKASQIRFATLDTDRMIISSSGHVGIGAGMTDPDASLEVYGPVQVALHVKGNDADALYVDTIGNSPYVINARLKNGGVGFQVESTSTSTGLINWVGGELHNNSDRTLKKDITDLGSCLDKVNKLRGVTFKWKEEHDSYKQDTSNSRYQMNNIGFIAQELEAEFPEIIDTNDNSGLKSIRNNNLQLTAILVEAVKELSAKVEVLEAQVSGSS